MDFGKFGIFIFVYLAGTCSAHEQTHQCHIDFYSGNTRVNYDVEGASCHDFPTNFNDKLTDLNVREGCILLFDDIYCAGQSKRVEKGKWNLPINQRFKYSSFQSCGPEEEFCITPTIKINTDSAPDLQSFGENVKSLMEEWFHRTCRTLWSPAYKEIDEIEVIFKDGFGGNIGADVWGKKIYASASYFKDHQDEEANRMFLHEMGHVVQQYKSGCGWVSEGMADLTARVYYKPRGKLKPGKDESYLTNWVYFTKWLQYSFHNLIYFVNEDCRLGRFDPAYFEEFTHKSLQANWEDMINAGKIYD